MSLTRDKARRQIEFKSFRVSQSSRYSFRRLYKDKSNKGSGIEINKYNLVIFLKK